MKVIKKSITIILIGFLLINIKVIAQVGVGTISPDASSMLDIVSSTKGFLPPRMNTTARDAIATPATGLLIFNTSTNKLNYYNGTSWQVVDAGTGSYVDLTTNQNSIAGNKTFTGNINTGMLTPNGRLMIPMGEMSYFNMTGTTINISSVSDGTTNFVKFSPASSATVNYMEFDNGGANDGTLRYTGATTRDFHIACTVSYVSNTGTDGTYVLGVAKGGVVIPSSKVLQRLTSTSDINSTAIHVSTSMSTNDKLTFWVGNTTGTGSIIIKSINLFALGM